ncbi:MAG: hypothetical protein KDC85_18230 [Saprospiraceae bacterium]|nr:hypothetical protein [Saprospiraceae bacterium]MCB9325873.1 hypothetical protein [Lewinellaceae bacterium]
MKNQGILYRDLEEKKLQYRKQLIIENLLIAAGIYGVGIIGIICSSRIIELFQKYSSKWPEFPLSFNLEEIQWNYSTLIFLIIPYSFFWLSLMWLRK